MSVSRCLSRSLDDPPRLEPHDSIGLDSELGTMDCQEDGTSVSQQVQRVGDELSALEIEVRRGLIEDHEGGLPEKRASESDALELAR